MNSKRLKQTAENRARSPQPESKVEHKSRIATAGRTNENASKPVSLAPLSFERALSGLLKVKPSRKKAAEQK
jgi:hypothetical protein